MISRDEVLSLIRTKVHHPATARELAQILRVPREERVSFKRQLKALAASGDLLQIRGNRFGVPDKMDLVVGRVNTNPAGFRLRGPGKAPSMERGAIFTSPPPISPKRCTAIAWSCASSDRPTRGPRGASSAFSSAARKPWSGVTKWTMRAWATWCRSIVGC
jgi:exoribonuclease R